MQESVGDTVPRFQPHLPRRTDLLVVLHDVLRSEEHTSELQSQSNLVCRLLLEKKNKVFLRDVIEKTELNEISIGIASSRLALLADVSLFPCCHRVGQPIWRPTYPPIKSVWKSP